MRVDQAKRLKDLEQEIVRLKKLVADLSLNNAILKEANRSLGDKPPAPEARRLENAHQEMVH